MGNYDGAMKRRSPPLPRTHPIAWVARGEGYSSEDGRFILKPKRGGWWLLIDTQAKGLIRDQAAPSLKAAQHRAEQIMESEDTPKEPWQ